MRGKVFDAEFFRGEVSRLTAWLGDLGITPEQRSQWNRELESAKQHLAEFGGQDETPIHAEIPTEPDHQIAELTVWMDVQPDLQNLPKRL